MRVLLLEDEVMLQSAIVEYLRSIGYEVDAFERGNEVYKQAKSSAYDLFIFDINTPDIDGLTLLQTLQEEKIHVPTIFISAITQIEQISQAYALGCYDYLKKPFHLKELKLHIERLFSMSSIQPKHFVNISAMYSYDLQKEVLLFNGQEQPLTRKQTQIMHLFASNRNCIINFNMLRYYAWEDRPIENAIIRAEIYRLRQVLHEELIVTLKGVGYKLINR
jgi:two-component system OmpR family response regulator